MTRSTLRSTMTRKHFKLIADALKNSKASDEVIRQMANTLATTNGRFDRDRFCAACKRQQQQKPTFDLKSCFADAANTGHEKYLAIYGSKVRSM